MYNYTLDLVAGERFSHTWNYATKAGRGAEEVAIDFSDCTFFCQLRDVPQGNVRLDISEYFSGDDEGNLTLDIPASVTAGLYEDGYLGGVYDAEVIPALGAEYTWKSINLSPWVVYPEVSVELID